MSAYVDGELTGAEMLEIRRHLSQCRECAEEYEATRFTKMAVASLRTVAPRRDFSEQILSRLDEISVPRYQRMINLMSDFFHKKFSPVAAAVAASGLALVILSASGLENVGPEQSGVIAARPYGVFSNNVASLSLGVSDSPVSITTSKPLVIVKEKPELSGNSIQLASFTTH